MEPGIPFGVRTLPLSPDPLFYLSLVMPGSFGTLDEEGRAEVRRPWNFRIRPLRHFRIYSAFLTLDPEAPAHVGTISNGVELAPYSQ